MILGALFKFKAWTSLQQFICSVDIKNLNLCPVVVVLRTFQESLNTFVINTVSYKVNKIFSVEMFKFYDCAWS